MFQKDSRYAAGRPFDIPADQEEAFQVVRPRSIRPAAGVIEHVIRAGDRLDLLAGHYYNDSRLWWRIVDANRDFLCGADMLLDQMLGQTILIPKARE